MMILARSSRFLSFIETVYILPYSIVTDDKNLFFCHSCSVTNSIVIFQWVFELFENYNSSLFFSFMLLKVHFEISIIERTDIME